MNDDDTSRNTWYNETIVTSVTSVGCSTLTDLRGSASTTASGTTVVSATSQRPASTNTPASTTGGPGTAPAPHPPVVCTPTNCSGDAELRAGTGHRKIMPAVPPKPKVRDRAADTSCSSRQSRPPTEQTLITSRTEEHTTLLARVHALEKVGCRRKVIL